MAVTHEARDALRLAALNLQAEAGRRLTLSDVVLAALAASDALNTEQSKR